MDGNLGLQTTRGEVLEGVDLSQLQGEINKLNPSVLRGIDGGTYHFITIPRSGDTEYIDHVSRHPNIFFAEETLNKIFHFSIVVVAANVGLYVSTNTEWPRR